MFYIYISFVSHGLFAREKVNSWNHFWFIYRLVKEKMMYEKEAKQQEEKIEKMKAEDGENYAIKKQVNYIFNNNSKHLQNTMLTNILTAL